jgi:hypothetical protein
MLLSPPPTLARRTCSPTRCRLVRSPCRPPSLLVRSRAHRGPGRSSPCLSFFQNDAALLPVHRTQLTCVAGAARLALAFTEDVETSVVKLCSAVDYRHRKLTSPYAHLYRPTLSRVCIIDLAPFRLLGAPCFCAVCCARRIRAIRVRFSMSPAQLFAATRTNFSTSACSPSIATSETLCSYSVRSLPNICSVILIKSICV